LKDIISHINRQFENRVRLGIMSVLMVEEWAEFKQLREVLQVTDGNLSSHASALEKAGYIQQLKEFVGKRPKTSYRATAEGRKAFRDHLNALEKLLKENRSD
jgi:DNA-binding MarR family transcriptional regulator